VTLSQTANAGNGGSSAGAAGNGSSSLSANNSGGGNITATSRATGGSGSTGSSNSNGSNGGNAVAAIDLGGSANVTGTATAAGGNGGRAVSGNGNAGNGGNASLGTLALDSTGGGALNMTANVTGGNGGYIFSNGTGNAGNGGTAVLGSLSQASSTGGNVNVSGNATGGNGGYVSAGSGSAGNGQSVSLDDLIDGSTTGRLTLSQVARGGNSGNVLDGLNGVAGNAFSSLSKVGSSSFLIVDARAFGGDGGQRDAATGTAAAGGTATTATSISNNAGEARANWNVNYDARGGTGGAGRNGANGGAGGSASQTTMASTIGDFTARTGGGAWGGNGGAVNLGNNSTAGAGGNAISSSSATSSANGTISASDSARGGIGGNVNSGIGSGGLGGNASSTAFGGNAGSVSVNVVSTATGGSGGAGRGTGRFAGNGGLATSLATGSGLGNVTVLARANGGNPGAVVSGAGLGLGGNGVATAISTGVGGYANAQATVGTSNGWLVNDVITAANAPLSNTGSVVTTATAGSVAKLSGSGFNITAVAGQQASALAYGAPDSMVSLPMVYDNAVMANFDIAGSTAAHTINNSGQLDSDVFGVGVLGGAYVNASGLSKVYSSTADFDVDTTLLQTADQNLLVGFMTPVISGSGFNDPDFSVRFRIQVEGSTVQDVIFTDEVSALAYFDSVTLDLGGATAGIAGDLDVKFLLDVTADSPDAGFAVDYIFGNSTVTPRAVPTLPVTSIAFGDRHVGDMVNQGVVVRNVASAGSDNASAQFNGTTGNTTTNSGSITALAPGVSDNTSMLVGIDTSTSGIKSGTATVQLSTDGSVTGTAEVFGSAEVTVGGTIYAFAAPAINNIPVSFGNVRVDDVISQTLSISNNAANDGFSENLNAVANGTSGPVSATGFFDGLAPQATDNSNISISIDTTTAGIKAGTATIDFVSDGAGINSLGQTALPSQVANVSGTVFRLAAASGYAPGSVVLNARVGDTVSQTLSITNTAANDGFSERLSANIGNAAGAVTVSGNFNLLGAQATDNSNLVVALNTSVAGAQSGTAVITLESDGTGTSNIVPNAALPSQTVNVSGNVWAPAVASIQPVVDFGIVHVGDTVSKNVSAGNVASGALTDVLKGGFNSVAGPFNGSGNLGTGVAAGDTDSSSLTVGLDTSTAGVFSGDAIVGLLSNNPDLADLLLPNETVALTAQVNNYANPDYNFVSGDGALTGGGDAFLLNFGTVVDGTVTSLSATLDLLNNVAAPADSLSGLFDGTGAGSFTLSGFNDFASLDAGVAISDLIISLDVASLGIGFFSGDIILNATGFNSSGFTQAFSPITLSFQGQVSAVPVPPAVWLFLSGILGLVSVARRRVR